MKVHLPPVIGTRKENGNTVTVMSAPPWDGDADIVEYSAGRTSGYRIEPRDGAHAPVVLLTKGAGSSRNGEFVLRHVGLVVDTGAGHIDLSAAGWVGHPIQPPLLTSLDACERRVAEIVESWRDAFSYKRERAADGTKGLRPPQLGAIHAAQGHLAVHRDPATIVMPTGTGKTETMLSLLITEQCPRVLVVVPTDALRTQIGDKFQSLGVLKEFEIVGESALCPIVGMLKKRPRSIAEVDLLFRKCNVVVATMSALSGCHRKVQEHMAALVTHVFIDEAHHVAAPTWEAFKKTFAVAKILQFTATPYRNDEKPIGGKIIFNYPLRQAQHDGYFKPITFKHVLEFNPRMRDRAIAEAAVEQLRADEKRGHVLMARVESVKRAAEVFAIYEQYAAFHPVQIHSGLPAAEREEVRRKILSGEARIIVCVDMLGEGFDLPQLKIAAFHDIRRSLPVTLQLAGRFTRSRPELGNATFVANIADVEVKDELRKLYQRDVDWNALLPQYSDQAIQEEFDLWQFIEGFQKFPDELSLQNVRPAMSMVAYRTKCEEWNPENFSAGIKGFKALDRVFHDVNPDENTLVIVTTRRVPVDWARVDDIYTWDWQLYILHWDKVQQLLFIHNSSNSGFFKELAEAVAGDVRQICGPEVFRALAAVNRLRLHNVGLLEQLGRLIRFTMRAGSDVGSGLTEAQKQKTIKSNLFGAGFEGGHRTSIGCSYKGRVWSHQTTNLQQFTRWCEGVGEKLIDESLNPEDVLKGTLVPELVAARPEKMPIGVDWPDVFYREPEDAVVFGFGKAEVFLHDADISLVDSSERGPLTVAVETAAGRAVFTLKLFEHDDVKEFRFEHVQGVMIDIARAGTVQPLAEFFNASPPTIWFADGSSLCGNEFVALPSVPEPFSRDRIAAWSWKGIDIRKESQDADRKTDSIQYRVIERLKKTKEYTLLFDDDDQGESADVVALRELPDSIEIEFYHCKFSGGDKAGGRIKDLYEVCGQAQKSIRWMEKPTDLFTHLLKREPRRRGKTQSTRFEIGTIDDLVSLREKSRRMHCALRVFIVQPGLSRSAATTAQLELLAVTENYLMSTFMVPFGVVASA